MILAIDQGTTGSTCLVFDEDGKTAGRAYSEFQQYFPKAGWVEHDASEIWEVTREVTTEAIADAEIEGSDLAAIGITNQRETIVAWDPSTGEPVHNALVWQDRRTARRCDELIMDGHVDLIREHTGLVCDPYFSGTKIQWLRENVDAAREAVFGTIDSWLVHKLCGEHVTDYTNASRTLLFNIHDRSWDSELCSLLDVDPDSLPEAHPSAHIFGTTTEFGGEVPVAGIAGDQQAALFGQACHDPGDAKNTYGTGSFVLLNTGSEAPEAVDGLLTTIAASSDGEPAFALEASMFVTGAAVQWLRDGLGLIEEAAETEELARSVDGSNDVYFVPAMAGLGSPWWDPYARGTICGITRGTTRAHLIRATLESIAFQAVDAVRAQEEASGESLEALKADGGAASNAWLMQFQADVLGVPVIVPEVSETTALGAAYLAGIASELWTQDDVVEMWRERATYEPQMSEDERETLLARWHQAVERSRGWAAE